MSRVDVNTFLPDESLECVPTLPDVPHNGLSIPSCGNAPPEIVLWSIKGSPTMLLENVDLLPCCRILQTNRNPQRTRDQLGRASRMACRWCFGVCPTNSMAFV